MLARQQLVGPAKKSDLWPAEETLPMPNSSGADKNSDLLESDPVLVLFSLLFNHNHEAVYAFG